METNKQEIEESELFKLLYEISSAKYFKVGKESYLYKQVVDLTNKLVIEWVKK